MKNKGMIGWAVVVLAIVVAAFLGVRYPVPPAPEAPVVEGLSRAAGYNTACFREQGGNAFQCDSGGGFVVGPGGTFTFEGATDDAFKTALAVVDPTGARTVTLPNLSGYALLTTNPGKVVFGANPVTGTLVISHGLTTPEAAFCTMGSDPVNDEEDRCTVTISSSTVTVKVWKEAASPTAGDSAMTVYWMVAGQP